MSKGLGKIERLVMQCLTDYIAREKETWGYDCDSVLLSDLIKDVKDKNISEPSIRRAIKSLEEKRQICRFWGETNDYRKYIYVGFCHSIEENNSDDFLPNEYSTKVFNYEQNIIDTLVNNGGICKQSLFSQLLTSKGYERKKDYAKGNERAVKKLLKKGIISRIKSEDDKRTYIIELSKKYIKDNNIKVLPPMGKEEIEKIKQKIKDEESKMYQCMAKILVENAMNK